MSEQTIQKPGLTIEETASRLGVSVSTLKRMKRRRQIPYIRVTARKHFFRPSDVDQYLEKQTVRTAGRF